MLSSLCLDCKHTRRHGDVHGVVVFVQIVKWVIIPWFSHTQSCDKINVSVSMFYDTLVLTYPKLTSQFQSEVSEQS